MDVLKFLGVAAVLAVRFQVERGIRLEVVERDQKGLRPTILEAS